MADRQGFLLAEEIPVYAIKTRYLKQRLVRQLAARELESAILTNGNHPSVMWWSIGNELSARPGPVQGYYIQRAARSAKRLDPTRPAIDDRFEGELQQGSAERGDSTTVERRGSDATRPRRGPCQG